MLGYFKDRNTLCLKYLSLDPMLDKPVFAAIYLAQPGDMLREISVLLLEEERLVSLHLAVESPWFFQLWGAVPSSSYRGKAPAFWKSWDPAAGRGNRTREGLEEELS